ncbi:uncharacterized protein FIBRA_01535 [Fibroporia radiculosa]|uniref:Carboxylesterase type B domain-containing protein n=1 Tax=Fibroporia radiculosa TaxID=599839 RepID=J4HTH5_9APHY|nr:uncharacterized protein FIBRA_01535 [Fibroporia radiculosa]CCL99517.1 predicted protein [Fibroporia radiculosa]
MPFIGGHLTDDGSIFVGNPANFVNTTEGGSSLKAILWERAITAFGDTVFTCMDWFIGQKLLSEGYENVYNYRFNTPDPVQLAANPWEGVMHTSELFFLFQGTNSGPNHTAPTAVFAPFNSSEQVLATETIGYWTSFARAFDSNAFKPLASSPLWLSASSHQRLVNQEGGPNSTKSRMKEQEDIYIQRCLFWSEVGNETRV